MTGEATATRWLEPLRAAVSELTEPDLAQLCRFEHALRGLLAGYPVNAGLEDQIRSRHLRQIRRGLAEAGHLALAVPARDGGGGRPAVMQALLQFICGYHDVDLRDSSGLGHGRLVAEHATPQVRDRWLPVLLAGAVPGIAITEPCGGSQVHATQTTATPARGGTWAVSGTKTWISRADRGGTVLRVLHRPRRAAHGDRHRRSQPRTGPPAHHPSRPVRMDVGRTAPA